MLDSESQSYLEQWLVWLVGGWDWLYSWT